MTNYIKKAVKGIQGVVVLLPDRSANWREHSQYQKQRAKEQRLRAEAEAYHACTNCRQHVSTGTHPLKRRNKFPKDLIWIASTKRRIDETSFLDLPRELRDRIYELLLRTERAVHLGNITLNLKAPHQWQPYPGTARSDSIVRYLALTPSLLAVSKQLHRETAETLYGHNTFSMTLAPSADLRRDCAKSGARQDWRLPDILPFNSQYLSLVRDVCFEPARPESSFARSVFTEAMYMLLAGVEGAYVGFVPSRSQDAIVPRLCHGCDAHLSPQIVYSARREPELLAGWCAAGLPIWSQKLTVPPPTVRLPKDAALSMLLLFAENGRHTSLYERFTEHAMVKRVLSECAVEEQSMATMASYAGWVAGWVCIISDNGTVHGTRSRMHVDG